MALSINPIVGFNFLSSESSVYGEAITLTAANSATRNNTDGLVLTGSFGRRFSATAPAAIKINAPITLWARCVRSQNGAAGTSGFGVGGTATDSWRYAHNDRGISNGWRGRYDNNGTLVTVTTSTTPVNPETVNYFLQFTSSAITVWQDTTQKANSSASRNNPSYLSTDVLYFGSPAWTNDTTPFNITHAAIWNNTLTSQDRTDLVADPLAFLPNTNAPRSMHYSLNGMR